ncbi:unnamed protein product [Prunus armeniaca]
MVNEDVDLRSKPGVGVMPGSPQGSSRVPGKFGTGPVKIVGLSMFTTWRSFWRASGGGGGWGGAASLD